MFQLYSYSDYLKKTFGSQAYKIVVSSGLTCPTRDGTLTKNGCAFCDVRGSSSFYGKKGRGLKVKEQILERLPRVQTRFSAHKFLAYFQSYTNTYTTDIDYLRALYTEALNTPGISGLAISTRPDCLPDSVLFLLDELSQNHYLSLELGVQSFEDETLKWLVRGHDALASIDAITRTRKRAPKVHICAHLMFGSPTDSLTMAQDAARQLNALDVHGVKLHQLMVLENTDLAKRWKKEPFKTLELEEYTRVVADFLKTLSPQIFVERLSALATHPEECLAPLWSRDRWKTHNEMRRLLTQWHIVQGQKIEVNG